MQTWIHYLLIFAIAFAATIAFVPLVRRFAKAHGIVDEPGPRRVNRRPVPRLGGVAMFGGLLVAVIVEYVCERTGLWHGPLYIPGEVNVRSIGVLVGLAVVVVVGIIDDVRNLGPGTKFLGQLLASCIIAATGTILHTFQIPGSSAVIDFGFWAYPITVIYLVCFINIINLIDGLDGLAAGITGMAAITLFIMFMTLHQTEAALLAAITAAIAGAFLVYNFYPASIFMGDSGSMLLGLLLGSVSLVGTTRLLHARRRAHPPSPAPARLLATQGGPTHLLVDSLPLRRDPSHVDARGCGKDGDLHALARRLGGHRVQDRALRSRTPASWAQRRHL